MADTKTMYARYDSEARTLTFLYDGDYGNASDTQTDYLPNTQSWQDPGWVSVGSKIDKVIFDASFKDARPSCCWAWFKGFGATEFEGWENLNTSEVTTMGYMFNSVNADIDLSNFNTSKVTDMQYMFAQCLLVTALDVSSFDTSVVTNMEDMFRGCSSLTELDVSGFDVSQCKDIKEIFYNCSKITTLDTSNWDVSKNEDLYAVFFGCAALKRVNVKNWTMNQCWSVRNFFRGCTSLTYIDISGWIHDSKCSYGAAFYECTNIKQILVWEGFTVDKIGSDDSMFGRCYNLPNYDSTKVNKSMAKSVKDGGYLTYKEDLHWYKGSKEIVSIYKGTKAINEIWKNGKLVWWRRK